MAETITVQCGCGAALKAPADRIGQHARCPECGHTLTIVGPLEGPPIDTPAKAQPVATAQEAPARAVTWITVAVAAALGALLGGVAGGLLTMIVSAEKLTPARQSDAEREQSTARIEQRAALFQRSAEAAVDRNDRLDYLLQCERAGEAARGVPTWGNLVSVETVGAVDIPIRVTADRWRIRWSCPGSIKFIVLRATGGAHTVLIERDGVDSRTMSPAGDYVLRIVSCPADPPTKIGIDELRLPR